jgi:phosphoserine phosphatase
MNDPLPSWNDTATKTAIQDFVAEATTIGSTKFRPRDERVAVFDNDGTLWCEQPVQAQVLFAMSRAQEMATADPSLRERQPFKAFLEHDMKTIHALGKQAVFEFAFSVHAGMTVDAFSRIARTWLATERHPVLRRPYTDTVYKPQIELMAFLRANGFKTFIVSGGGLDFMRAFAERAYGVPPWQVIGSTVKTHFQMVDGRCELMKLAELGSFNDRDAKVENIGLHIGRKPIFAFGNSDGDLAMLRYTMSGTGPCMSLLLHHDDAVREMEYDREFRLSPLSEALDRAAEFGIRIVSMKNDWAKVFPAQHTGLQLGAIEERLKAS